MTTEMPEGWQPLPAGYVIPGLAPPVLPLCGRADRTGAGWNSTCDSPATHGHQGERGFDEYACAPHLAEAARTFADGSQEG